MANKQKLKLSQFLWCVWLLGGSHFDTTCIQVYTCKECALQKSMLYYKVDVQYFLHLWVTRFLGSQKETNFQKKFVVSFFTFSPFIFLLYFLLNRKWCKLPTKGDFVKEIPPRTMRCLYGQLEVKKVGCLFSTPIIH